MIEGKDQLIDIYDIWYEPFWKQDWFYALTTTIVILLILLSLWYIYKKYKIAIEVVDCSILAYQDLEKLKKFHIATKQDSKDCYFKLSSIIKQYLACRYNKIFMKLTDKEILKQAEFYIDDKDIYLLKRILQGMLFIKFEHEVAAYEKLEKDIQLVREFIENTTHLEETKEV